jgi:hypothetical protein
MTAQNLINIEDVVSANRSKPEEIGPSTECALSQSKKMRNEDHTSSDILCEASNNTRSRSGIKPPVEGLILE